MEMKTIYPICFFLVAVSCIGQPVYYSDDNPTGRKTVWEDTLVAGTITSINGQALHGVEVIQVAVKQLRPHYKNVSTCKELQSYIDNIPEKANWDFDIDDVNVLSRLDRDTTNYTGEYKTLVKSKDMLHTTLFNSKVTSAYAFIFFIFRKEGYQAKVVAFAPQCEGYNLQKVKLKAK